MKSVQENIASKNNSKKLMLNHCLCANLVGNIVYLPCGYYPDALRINETSKGYDDATQYLEKVWKDSMSIFNL